MRFRGRVRAIERLDLAPIGDRTKVVGTETRDLAAELVARKRFLQQSEREEDGATRVTTSDRKLELVVPGLMLIPTEPGTR